LNQIDASSLTLNNKTFLGKGGEAEVYKIDNGKVAKIFKDGTHPDWLNKQEKDQANQKLVEYQNKLKMFPSRLPQNVIAPIDLIVKKNYVIGYTMKFIDKGEVLKKYGEKTFREKLNEDANIITDIFKELRETVSSVHKVGVVIGDFNDLNILIIDDKRRKNNVFVIDSDSFQFGQFFTKVFTTRFVDPLLCNQGLTVLSLSNPHTSLSDWYAFNVMLFQSLLYVHPYGGIYQPQDQKKRIPHEARALHSVSVFNSEVKYPKAALPLKYLSDETLGYFENVFEKKKREEFPLKILNNLRWHTCVNCGVSHCRSICPECQAQNKNVVTTTQIRGTVKSTEIFKSKNRSHKIVYANEYGGALQYLLWKDDKFYRETGYEINQIPLMSGLKFRIQKERTLIGFGDSFIIFDKGAHVKYHCDVFQRTPMFDCNSSGVFYIQNGNIYKQDDIPILLGEVLASNTAFWVGEEFGFGFYLASAYSQCFTFGLNKKSLNDSCKIRIEGKLIDSNVYFNKDKAWVFLSTQIGADIINKAYLIDQFGNILSSAEAKQSENTWLSSIKGKLAIGKTLFSSSENGISRIEDSAGTLVPSKEFPDTEPFVDSNTYLFSEKTGIYAVNSHSIKKLEIS
jgi:H/ACA ribonucleoprotein complex subunit 3